MSVTITVNDDGTVKGWLTPNEYADQYGIKPGQVRRAVQRGKIYSIHIGPIGNGLTLIPEDAKLYSSRKPAGPGVK